jgi:hypothetical protein
MNKPLVISIGEILWDLFPDGERFGGAPANFACHASSEGAEVVMLSAVGHRKRCQVPNRQAKKDAALPIFTKRYLTPFSRVTPFMRGFCRCRRN